METLALLILEIYDRFQFWKDGVKSLFKLEQDFSLHEKEIDIEREEKIESITVWVLTFIRPHHQLSIALNISDNPPSLVEAPFTSSKALAYFESSVEQTQESMITDLRNAMLLRFYLDKKEEVIQKYISKQKPKTLFTIDIQFSPLNKKTFHLPHLNLTQWRALWKIYSPESTFSGITSPQKDDTPLFVDAFTIQRAIKEEGISQIKSFEFSVRPQDRPHTISIDTLDGPKVGEVLLRGPHERILLLGEEHVNVDLKKKRSRKQDLTAPITPYFETLARTYPDTHFALFLELGKLDHKAKISFVTDALGRTTKVVQDEQTQEMNKNMFLHFADIRRTHLEFAKFAELFFKPQAKRAVDVKLLQSHASEFLSAVDHAVSQVPLPKDRDKLHAFWEARKQRVKVAWDGLWAAPNAPKIDDRWWYDVGSFIVRTFDVHILAQLLSSFSPSTKQYSIFYGGSSHFYHLKTLLIEFGFQTPEPPILELTSQSKDTLSVKGLNQYFSHSIVGAQPWVDRIVDETQTPSIFLWFHQLLTTAEADSFFDVLKKKDVWIDAKRISKQNTFDYVPYQMQWFAGKEQMSESLTYTYFNESHTPKLLDGKLLDLVTIVQERIKEQSMRVTHMDPVHIVEENVSWTSDNPPNVRVDKFSRGEQQRTALNKERSSLMTMVGLGDPRTVVWRLKGTRIKRTFVLQKGDAIVLLNRPTSKQWTYDIVKAKTLPNQHFNLILS